MMTIFLVACAVIIIYHLRQYYRWQLETERLDKALMELVWRMQAERIQELEKERDRLHLQLLAHLGEPGQERNEYRN